MNYYPFHIGDYAAHTQRLSLMEDLAYRRMIDAYYLDERPFNGCAADVARAIGMLDQMESVEYVLGKFFQHSENGFSNIRCDEEIAHYHDKQAKASSAGRASAERRLNKKSTDVEKTATDEQLTKNQEPITNKKNTSAIAPPDGVDKLVWADFLKLRKTKKASLTQTALDGIAGEVAKAGWSMNDAISECCTRGWISFKADWVAKDQKTISAENAIKRGSDEYAKLHKSASWWAKAGFESVWNAMDAGCYHDTFNRFSDGKKLREATA